MTSPAEGLADAEVWARHVAEGRWTSISSTVRHLPRIVAEYDRRGAALEQAGKALESSQGLASTLQRYLDKASDEIDQLRDAHREATGNRDATINRLLGDLAAVRALCRDRYFLGNGLAHAVFVDDVLAAVDGTTEDRRPRQTTASPGQDDDALHEVQCPQCDATTRARMADAPTSAPVPSRDDHIAAWFKRCRDEILSSSIGWAVLDDVLDQYRLHADTGTPLDQHACEGSYCCSEPDDRADRIPPVLAPAGDPMPSADEFLRRYSTPALSRAADDWSPLEFARRVLAAVGSRLGHRSAGER